MDKKGGWMSTTLEPAFMDPGLYIRAKRPIRPIFETRPKRIWLLSFTDLISLIVCFFVMMYAMSEPQLEQFRKISSAFEDELAIVHPTQERSYQGAPLHMGDEENISLPRQQYKTGLNINYLSQVVAQKRTEVPALKDLTLSVKGGEIILDIPVSAVYVDAAMTTLRPAALRALGGLFGGIPNDIQVVLNVKDTDIQTYQKALRQGFMFGEAMNRIGYKRFMPVIVRQNMPSASSVLTFRMTQYDAEP